MLLDSSALVCAVMRGERYDRLNELLEHALVVAVGAPILLEASIVLTGRGVDASRILPRYLQVIGAEILDFRSEHETVALQAFFRFGKGRHPARLSYGDCMSYSYASLTGRTLVYKGEDFGQTDLVKIVRLDESPIS